MGLTGEQIYANFVTKNPPEAAGLSQAAQALRAVSGAYEDLANRIMAVGADIEASWTGEAGGAASRGVGPMAVELSAAAPHLATANDLLARQADSFNHIKNSVEPVPPAPSEDERPNLFIRTFVGEDDYQNAVRKHHDAAQRNVDLMNGYTAASSYNERGMPQRYGNIITQHESSIIIEGVKKPGRHGGSGIPPISYGPGGGHPYNGGGGTAATNPGHHDNPHLYTSARDADDRAHHPSPHVSQPVQPANTSYPPSRNLGPESTNLTAWQGPEDPTIGSRSGGWNTSSSTGSAGSLGYGFNNGVVFGPVGSGATLGGGNMSGRSVTGPHAGSMGGVTSQLGTGAGAGLGALGAAERAAAREGALGALGLPGVVGQGHKGEDTEHRRPNWLVESNPDDIFGDDLPPTAPPVIGE